MRHPRRIPAEWVQNYKAEWLGDLGGATSIELRLCVARLVSLQAFSITACLVASPALRTRVTETPDPL